MSSQRGIVDLRKRSSGITRRNVSPLRFPEKKQRTPLRIRRRRIRALWALLALILLGALVWSISYVSYLPRFQVGDISVVGAQDVSPQLVQAYAQTQLAQGGHPFLSPDNIFLYNPKRLAREIVGYFPRIKSVQVSRASMLSTPLQISITERQPFALWCDDAGNCYTMDDTGFIFAQVPAASSTMSYVFKGAVATSTPPIGHSFAPAHLPGILALLQMLEQAQFTPQGASVESDHDFSVPLAPGRAGGQALTQGFYIKASFGEEASSLVRNLQLILSSDALQGKEDQLEYVDLRFGDKVYYKLKGAAETKAPSSY